MARGRDSIRAPRGNIGGTRQPRNGRTAEGFLRVGARSAKSRVHELGVHKEQTMAGTVEKKLADLGITLHTPAPAIANYVPFVRTGNYMVVSGQLCFDAAGQLVAQGQLGAGVSIEDGQKAAR